MKGSGRQRGVVLIVVLWVVALLTVLLAAFAATVKVERQTVADVTLGIQARASMDAVLNYLAALNLVMLPEDMAAMQGQRYELLLNEQVVAFRILPESSFIPVNTLDAPSLAAVFSGMDIKDADSLAERLVFLREEEVDEDTGQVRPALLVQSALQLAHVLGLEVELLRPYERWLSFYGAHSALTPGHVPEDVLSQLGLAQEMPLDDSMLSGQMATVLRVQVEVDGGRRPRQVDAIASFSGAQYKLLQINEYNVSFSLTGLSDR